MLQVTGIKVAYGPIEAVKDVSFCIGEGSIVSLIGPNGAGKSTILNALSGWCRCGPEVLCSMGRTLHE